MFEVLKNFKYASNGIDVKDLQKGDIVEILPDLVSSLTSGGFVKLSKKVEGKIETAEVKLETKPAPTRRRSK